MEIEFKLSCTPEIANRLSRQLTRLTGAPPHRLQLKNTYFDTPNQDLRANGAALRIRRQGPLSLQTVKCVGQTSGGMSSRPEWETPYTGHFDFSQISDSAVKALLETLARLPGYRATLTTDFNRSIWEWKPDTDTCIELMLDRGHIRAGGKEEPICELELELVKGDPAQLIALVAQLGTLAPLFPAPLSKASRGSQLLSGKRKIEVTDMSLSGSTGDAFTRLAQDNLDQISINLPANRHDFKAENLHQVRVGLRRLRALLQLFKPRLEKHWLKHAEQGARHHMQAIAAARAYHVLIDSLILPALPSETLQTLHTTLVTHSEHAFAQARAHLLSASFSEWLLQVSLTLPRALASRKQTSQAWGKVAPTLLNKQIATYAKRIKATRHEPEALHVLRKQGKHLRYQLNACGSRDRQLIKSLARLQETLGAFNDLYSAGDILEPLAQQSSALHKAVRHLGERQLANHQTMLDSILLQKKAVQANLPVRKGKGS